MDLRIEHDQDALAAACAGHVADYIRKHPGSLLCFAAGDTPLKMLGQLVSLQREGSVDLASARYVGLDEWLGIGCETRGSCCQVMRDHFYTPAGIPKERMRIWDGRTADPQAECARINAWIEQWGGIGLVLLGIGMNGHIGFNEPGAPLDLDCMVVPLDEVSTRVGRKYFGGAACPQYGITIGMPRLLASGEALLMASGAHKAPVLRRALMEDPAPDCPASMLQRHPRLKVFLDREAWRGLPGGSGEPA